MNRRLLVAGMAAMAAHRTWAYGADAPIPELAGAQGAWRGKLTYRDYASPYGLVTLPTRLYVALTAPAELALHFAFDDGPTKTVYSYERMAFDFGGKQVTWTSDATPRLSRITSAERREGALVLSFERDDHNGSIDRHVLSLNPSALSLGKEEGTPSSGFVFRNRFEFSRG